MSKNFEPVCLRFPQGEPPSKATPPPVEFGHPDVKKNLSSTKIRGSILPLVLLCLLIFTFAFPAFALTPEQIEKEVAAGRKVAESVEKEFELLSDPAAIARLESILQKLTQHIEIDYPWQVKIIRKEELNAFCLPGGFIYFFTGILNKFDSDAEIAAVMAHEIAHVLERHGVKQSARNTKLSLAALLIVVATGGAAAPAIMAQVAQVAIMNSYSIEYEQEADIEGIKMLMSAGYTPSAIVTTMEKFMTEELKQPIYNYGVYMSHPESRKRVEYLAKYLRDRKIPLRRKEALLTLRARIEERADSYALLVDDAEVWSGPKNDDVKTALEKCAEAVNTSLQMELAPYNLAVDGAVLRIGNSVAASKPLPSGMPTLEILREKLLERVLAAQRKHPIANYFRQ